MTITDQATSTPLVYDPYAYEIHEDPYPTYRRMREEAPVYRNDERNFWALSRYDDVMASFRDSERFSNAHGVSIDPAASGPNAHRTMSFLAMDPPQHGRMRGLISRGFTPRRVAEMEQGIRNLTTEHLDRCLEMGSFDFVAELAGKVPMDVISEMLGVPHSDRVELRRLSDSLIHREEGVTDVPPAGIEAALQLVIYYADMISSRRANPGDDLITALCAAEVDGDRLGDDEIMAFLFLMVVAGNETTTKLLGNAVYWAGRNQDQLASVFADHEQVPLWVEETLRYDTSSQILARTVVEDIEFYGTTLHDGDVLLLVPGAAHRDERVFDEPDEYRIGRDIGSKLLSFGSGAHFCLGAHLARMEGRVALQALVERVRGFEVDEANAVRVHSSSVRGFANLPITVKKA